MALINTVASLSNFCVSSAFFLSTPQRLVIRELQRLVIRELRRLVSGELQRLVLGEPQRLVIRELQRLVSGEFCKSGITLIAPALLPPMSVKTASSRTLNTGLIMSITLLR